MARVPTTADAANLAEYANIRNVDCDAAAENWPAVSSGEISLPPRVPLDSPPSHHGCAGAAPLRARCDRPSGTGPFSSMHRTLIGCRHVAGGGSSTERRQQAVLRRLMPLIDDHPAPSWMRPKTQTTSPVACHQRQQRQIPPVGWPACPRERFGLLLAPTVARPVSLFNAVRLDTASSSSPDRAGCGASPAASSPQPLAVAFFPAALPLPRAPKKPPPSVLRSAPARP